MSALGDLLGALAPVLDRHAEGWFLFGAQAVAVRGAPRATQDVDITVKIARARLPMLIEETQTIGFAPRFPELAEELLRAGAVIPLTHQPSHMDVDLVLAGSGLEDLALSRTTRMALDGVSVPVAHATDLVVMKVLAGRGKDLDDVRSLLATGEVDRDEVLDLLRQLESALGQSDLKPRFLEAVAEAD